MSSTSLSSEDISLESETSECEKQGKQSNNKKKRTYFLLIAVVLVIFLVFIMVVCVTLVILISGGSSHQEKEDSHSTVPIGMKKVFFNHLTYEEDSKNVVDAETSLLYVDENEDFENFHITQPNEVYYISENHLKVECDITCVCQDDRRASRLQNIVKIISYAIIVSSSFIIIKRRMGEKCDEDCGDNGYSGQDSEVDNYECKNYEDDGIAESFK